MNLRCLCKECLLHNKQMHDCFSCPVDFSNEQSVLKHAKEIRKSDKKTTADVVVRKTLFGNEILHFNKEFSILGNTSKTCNRGRLFRVFDDGSVEPKSKEATIKKLLHNSEKSRKRAIDEFINYGRNNEWGYFITLTFDPQKVNRESQSDVKLCWKLFRQKLQYYMSDIKILVVIEPHKESNGLHFHGVIGNVDLNNYIVRAVNMEFKNKKTNQYNEYYMQPIFTALGDKVYNFRNSVYNYGFSSVIPLTDKTSDMTVYDKIIFYLNKYMSKEMSSVQYNCKRYFHTRNLNKGIKIVTSSTDENFLNTINEAQHITLKKSNEKFTAYELRNTIQ